MRTSEVNVSLGVVQKTRRLQQSPFFSNPGHHEYSTISKRILFPLEIVVQYFTTGCLELPYLDFSIGSWRQRESGCIRPLTEFKLNERNLLGSYIHSLLRHSQKQHRQSDRQTDLQDVYILR